MNIIKRYFGVLWIIISLIAVYFIVSTAIKEISAGKPSDAPIFWPVIITIFLPICVGLALFGIYALKNEYKK